MDDLALEGIHGVKLEGFAALFDLFSASLCQFDQVLTLLSTETIDIKHQSASLSGRGLNRQAGQLLECVEDFAITPDKMAQLSAIDDEIGAIIVDRDLDIPVKVGNVE